MEDFASLDFINTAKASENKPVQIEETIEKKVKAKFTPIASDDPNDTRQWYRVEIQE